MNAITDFDLAIQLEPDNAAAYVNRGSAKGQLNHLLDAVADYDQAIRLRPDYALAYYNRGSTQVSRKLFKDGLADLHTAFGIGASRRQQRPRQRHREAAAKPGVGHA